MRREEERVRERHRERYTGEPELYGRHGASERAKRSGEIGGSGARPGHGLRRL